MNVYKPIPDDSLHMLPDAGLVYLVETYRRALREDPSVEHTIYVEARLDDVYKVMGYRCALDYARRNG